MRDTRITGSISFMCGCALRTRAIFTLIQMHFRPIGTHFLCALFRFVRLLAICTMHPNQRNEIQNNCAILCRLTFYQHTSFRCDDISRFSCNFIGEHCSNCQLEHGFAIRVFATHHTFCVFIAVFCLSVKICMGIPRV